MSWIKTRKPGPENPDVTKALAEGMAGYPPEYRIPPAQRYGVPTQAAQDSIASPHTLVPDVLRGIFQGYRAMLDPSLPLSRKEHELIATTVSVLNDCFY